MRKILLGLFILFIVIGFSFAEDTKVYSPGFTYLSPELRAQGGSTGGVNRGYDALFTNPAAFANDDGEFTLLSASADVLADPLAFVEEFDGQDFIIPLLNQLTTNGVGTGAQVGLGYVGKGWGIGFSTILDFKAPKTDTIAGATADAVITSAIVLGYSFDMDLGPVNLAIGGDVRPMFRMELQDLLVAELIADGFDLDAIDDMLIGWGVGFDAGAIVTWKSLRGSFTMRDIMHTRYSYNTVTMDEFKSGDYGTSVVGSDYMTPMSMNFGLAFDPDWRYFDPIIHADYTQPLVSRDYLDGYEYGTVWTRMNVGAEIELFNFLALRGGFQGGYLTAGVGLDLFFLEVNAAIYGEETGHHAGDQPTMGASLEVAIRF